ncbi:MAG: CDP-alcohol phosphatidyltransferase family protein [Chloroflexota bacterium]|nr:CDP-alcohol phosphatidyltransferase family protein [Chloroflexota bacterium]
MTWAHLLSSSRIIAAPFVAALILAPRGDVYLVAAALFAIAAFTDLIDGKLARYAKQVSPLGVFVDTSADKVFVSLALVAMAIGGLSPGWVPLVIIGREFLISGLRSYAASRDRIISAHIWGKGKAALTMVAIPLVLVAADGQAGGALSRFAGHNQWNAAFTVCSWLLGLSAVATVISGVRYVVDAWPLLRASESEPPSERSRAAGSR